MKKLSPEDILYLHYMVIEDFGGKHGVRDKARLLSLAESPYLHVFGKELYISVFDKAAVYMKSIISDHPFVDGNKRTAVIVAAVFLSRNGEVINTKPIDLADFAVRVATEKLSIEAIATWLKDHC